MIREELSPEAIRMLTGMRELVQRGWIQHHLSDEEDRVCLVGAEVRAGRRMQIFSSVWDEIDRLLFAEIGGPPAPWNDAPGRTQEDVLRLLDGILARARK